MAITPVRFSDGAQAFTRRACLVATGTIVAPSTPEELATLLKAEVAEWEAVIKDGRHQPRRTKKLGATLADGPHIAEPSDAALAKPAKSQEQRAPVEASIQVATFGE
jgi:hypothetical protein